ncbi:MAG TPA: hypothetical protein VGK11_03860 [Actinomycetota bacterium]|jgi:hypothetical protein
MMDTNGETRGEGGAGAAIYRDLCWAELATPGTWTDVGGVRALQDFAALMRDDERNVAPRGESNLPSSIVCKRRLKLRVFHLLPPISPQHDRLLGGPGELNAELAALVAPLKAEDGRLVAVREVPEDSG